MFNILLASTKIEELTFKIGFPYLYRHKGNCDHIFIFNDLRIFNPHRDLVFLKNENYQEG